MLEGGARRRRAVGRLRVRLRELRASPAGVQISLTYDSGAARRRRPGRPLLQHRGRDRLRLRRLTCYGNDQSNIFRGEGGDDLLSCGGLTAAATTAAGGGRRRTTGWTAAPATTCSRAAPGSTPPTSAQLQPRGRGGRPRRGTAYGGDPVGSDRLSGIENLQGTLYERPARRRRRGQRAGRGAGRRRAGRAGRRRPVRLRARPTTACPRRRTSSSTSAASRATGSTSPASTPTSRRRRPGVPVHRPGPVHRRRPGPLLPAGRRHDRRGQHDDTTRRRGDADRARPAGLAAGQRLPPVAAAGGGRGMRRRTRCGIGQRDGAARPGRPVA